MIDVLGPFLLILMMDGANSGEGISVQEMRDFESCKAAVVQLEPFSHKLQALCIAATTIAKETIND